MLNAALLNAALISLPPLDLHGGGGSRYPPRVQGGQSKGEKNRKQREKKQREREAKAAESGKDELLTD